jgi:hypothetical protein
MVELWDKQDWKLKKESKSKQYLLSYRNTTKLIFPEDFISTFEITFLPEETHIGIYSMGQLILRVMK